VSGVTNVASEAADGGGRDGTAVVTFDVEAEEEEPMPSTFASDSEEEPDEDGLPNLELKWRRVQSTCLDGGYFTEFEIKSLRVAYRRFLMPGCPEMHKDDLQELVRHLGYIVLSPAIVWDLANEITPYNDLDFDDVVRFVEKYARRECASFREIFDEYDEDNSGAISTLELRSLMADLGFNPSKQLIKEASRHLEHTENGELTFRELLHFFTVYRHTYGFCKAEIVELRETFESFTVERGIFCGMPILSVASGLIQAFGLQFEETAIAITNKVKARNSEDDNEAEQNEIINFEEFLAFARALKEAEQEQYRREFVRHDVDNSGQIEIEELQDCLRNLGHEPTRGVIVEVLKEVDFEEDGSLDMEEFYNFMLVFRDREGFQNQELVEMRQVFCKFDEDESESISVHELGAMLRYMGYAVTMGDLHMLIAQVDVDRSGDLDFREFIRLMRLHMKGELHRLRQIFDRSYCKEAPRGCIASSRLPSALASAMGSLPLVLLQALPLLLSQAAEKSKNLRQMVQRVSSVEKKRFTLKGGTSRLSSSRLSLEELDMAETRVSFIASLSKKMNVQGQRPLTDIRSLGRGDVVQVLNDASAVKHACAKAVLSDGDNVARGAAAGSAVYVVEVDHEAGTVRCHSDLHGDMWFALDALSKTQASQAIADAFADSLPALQSCGNAGIDFDAYVELADLFRTVRNVWDRMKAGFSDSEIKRCQAVFAMYDVDGSGDIDDKELMRLLRHVGIELKTRENQAALTARLAQARKLAQEAGVEPSGGLYTHSFWEFVQLMRMERTSRERAYEDKVLKTSAQLAFLPTEIAQFREAFIHWARHQKDPGTESIGIDAKPESRAQGVEDLLGDGFQEGVSMYSLIKLLQSLGCTVQTKDEPTLAARIESMSRNAKGQLNFVGFLQMMRWLLDSNFGGLNKVVASRKDKEQKAARPV
jgi:calmodulin